MVSKTKQTIEKITNPVKDSKQAAKVPKEVQEKLTKWGQEHVLKWVGELDDKETKSLWTQIEGVDIETLLKHFEEAKKSIKGATERLQPSPLCREDVILSAEGHWKVGLDAIKAGQVAIITLAGGQGTRLGSSAPKGCYDIGLPSKLSLFGLQALRIRKLIQMANSSTIPWYIMTSEATHGETINFFKENKWFGLGEDHVKFFKQGELPALSEDGKLIMKDKCHLAWSPNGNGGIYSALSKEGVLKELKDRGVKYVHMYCVDNALVRVADPKFIGACIGAGTDCAAKTILKTDPTEPVGIFCRRKDGKLIVGEYSELDSHVASQVDKDGKLIYNQANIANHFFTVDFLEKISKGKSLSMHLAHKKIPTVGGETMMGFKMEAFIFDVFEWAEKPVVYQGERWEEFAPLKNASGAKTDSPECCRKMLLDLHAKWLTKAGAKIEGAVEISPLISYAGEGLEKWKGKTVTGNLKDL